MKINKAFKLNKNNNKILVQPTMNNHLIPLIVQILNKINCNKIYNNNYQIKLKLKKKHHNHKVVNNPVKK